tara:strand:- start:3 stop:182 length:180 start_codon:yes stop_codon:yes gene_type:complete
MMMIINRLNVKKYTSELLRELRPEVKRISPTFLDKVDKQLKANIKEFVVKHKTKEKTLR